jgi:hypothetical protein
MSLRNLLDEMPNAHPRAKAHTAPIGAIMRSRSRSRGRCSDEFTFDELTSGELRPPTYSKFSVVVTVSDEMCDRLILAGDQVEAKAATVIQGEYSCVTARFGGKPCWKQERPTPPATNPMYIFYNASKNEGGWYIADSLINPMDPKSFEGEKYAWFDGEEAFPGDAHIPYWAKRKCEGVTIEPLVWHLARRVLELESIIQKHPRADTNAVAMELITDAEFRLETSALRIEELEAELAAAIEHVDVASTSSKVKVDNGKGKDGKVKASNHGGWAPKLASLINKVWKKDWTAVTKQSDKFYEHELIKMLCGKDRER